MRKVFHVEHCTCICVRMIIYVHNDSNETTETSYEAGESSAKSDRNCGVGGVEEASAVPAGGVGWHVQAAEEAGDFTAGRGRAGMVPTGRAGLPDTDQPGSAEGDERREKEGARVRIRHRPVNRRSKRPLGGRARPSGAWTGHPREFSMVRLPGPPAQQCQWRSSDIGSNAGCITLRRFTTDSRSFSLLSSACLNSRWSVCEISLSSARCLSSRISDKSSHSSMVNVSSIIPPNGVSATVADRWTMM